MRYSLIGSLLIMAGQVVNPGTGGGGGGNVSNSGTPSSGQAAEWVTSTTIQGVATTGTVAYVKSTSPTLVTPVLGVATATSINGTTIPASVTLTQTIASGTAVLGTSAISSGSCATVVTAAGTGIATTDVPTWSFNGDVTAVTGYAPSTGGGLALYIYPTLNTFNVKVCNPTSLSITPGAATLNWRVVR